MIPKVSVHLIIVNPVECTPSLQLDVLRSERQHVSTLDWVGRNEESRHIVLCSRGQRSASCSVL